MTTLAPIHGRSDAADPRDPLLRLTNFFDEGTMSLLHPRDKSGVQAAVGLVNGVRTISCTDGTVMGGAMGIVGCKHRQRHRHRHRRTGTGHRYLALGWRTPCRGRRSAARRRLRLRGDGAGIGLCTADLRRRRLRRRRRRLRAGAHRRRHHGPAGRVASPDPTSSRVSPARTSTWRRSADRSPTERSPASATSSPTPNPTPTGARGAWCPPSAARATSTSRRPPPATPTCARCCPNLRAVPMTCTPSSNSSSTPSSTPVATRPSPRSRRSRPSGRPTSSSDSVDSPAAASASSRTTRCAWAAASNSESAERHRVSSGSAMPSASPGRPHRRPRLPTGRRPGMERRRTPRRKLLHAFAECTVPRVTLVTRKIYGGACIAMNSRALGATAVYAWPLARGRRRGRQTAVGILHKRRSPPPRRRTRSAPTASPPNTKRSPAA